MQPKIESKVVLPLLPDGPISSVSSPARSDEADALQGPHLAGAAPELLGNVLCLQHDVCLLLAAGSLTCFGRESGCFSYHRLNTMAGSMRITLPIADRAEIAHHADGQRQQERGEPLAS